MAFALAWTGIAIGAVVIALLLGWRPFRSDHAIPFREQRVETEAAFGQTLPEGVSTLKLRAADIPSQVRRGDALHFVVELHNPTGTAVALDPCPALFSSFGESSTAAFELSRLNCAAADTVPAGGSLRFKWRIRVPDSDEFRDGFVGSIYLAIRGTSGSIDGGGGQIQVHP